jgi:hypothetical protein
MRQNELFDPQDMKCGNRQYPKNKSPQWLLSSLKSTLAERESSSSHFHRPKDNQIVDNRDDFCGNRGPHFYAHPSFSANAR